MALMQACISPLPGSTPGHGNVVVVVVDVLIDDDVVVVVVVVVVEYAPSWDRLLRL